MNDSIAQAEMRCRRTGLPSVAAAPGRLARSFWPSLNNANGFSRLVARPTAGARSSGESQLATWGPADPDLRARCRSLCASSARQSGFAAGSPKSRPPALQSELAWRGWHADTRQVRITTRHVTHMVRVCRCASRWIPRLMARVYQDARPRCPEMGLPCADPDMVLILYFQF